MKGLFQFLLVVFAAFLLAAASARSIRRALGGKAEGPYLERELY